MEIKGLHIENIISTLEGYLLKGRHAHRKLHRFLIKNKKAFVWEKGSWSRLSERETEYLIDKFVNSCNHIS